MFKVIKREIQDSLNGEKIMTLVIYDNIEECLQEFFLGAALHEVKEICGQDGKGNEYHLSTPEMIENIKESGCWGFLHKKEEIHLWLAPDCDLSKLIHLLGHERGHSIRPFHRSPENEEKKAELFGQTAKFAYQVALLLKQEAITHLSAGQNNGGNHA